MWIGEVELGLWFAFATIDWVALYFYYAFLQLNFILTSVPYTIAMAQIKIKIKFSFFTL